MLRILTVLMITLLGIILYENKLNAQVSITTDTAASGLSNSLYGIVSFKVNKVSDDTLIRVINILKKDKQIAAFKVGIISKENTHYFIIDKQIKDSLFASCLLNNSINKFLYNGCQIFLVRSENINAVIPIEDMIFMPDKSITDSLSKAANLIKKLPKDSLFKKIKPVTIKGNIITAGQLSDNKYVGQTIPENYIRTYVNAEVSLFGALFNVGYNYTTESNNGLNQINTFRLSFNYEQFYQNLKSNVERKINAEKEEQIKQLTKFDIDDINKEYGKLRSKLSSPEFLKQVEKNKRILEQNESDSLFKLTSRYKKALKQSEAYNKMQERLAKIDSLKEVFLSNERIANLSSGIKNFRSSTQSGFKKAMKSLGLSQPGYSLLLDIKKFDIGTFDPNYTTLVLSGVSLNGINAEINHGILYGAFTWGNSVANFSNPFAIDLSGGRTIMASRIGLGRTEKLLVAFSILKGIDGKNNVVLDSNYTFYSPQYNYVTGVDIKYKFNRIVDFNFEYAKSENQEIAKETRNNPEVYSGLLNVNNNKYSSAWNGVLNVNLDESHTKFHFLMRSVDPYYYSFGTPYLRRDNLRIEAKGEQSFWKKQITSSVSFRRDEDNLYNLKEATTKNNSVIFNLQLRIKKYPFLIITYTPNYQSTFNTATKQFVNSNVKVYNVILGYVVNKKKTVNTTTISYTKQYNEINISGYSLFHTDQYALTENILIKSLDMNLTSSLNYTIPLMVSDTGKIIVANVIASKSILKKKINISGGYSYQKDFTIMESNILQAGTSFSMGWGINCTIKIERHFIKNYRLDGQNQDMNIGRITLIKSF